MTDQLSSPTSDGSLDRMTAAMKITVRRSGGFAGLTRTWEVRIDDQADRDRWVDLLQELPWDEVPVVAQPDRYSYLIRVSHRRITLAEQQVSGAWRELVERVQHASD